MTGQEVFDTVVTHLRKQGKKALLRTNIGSTCQYRTPDGLMCAAGCLFLENEYNPAMEGKGIKSLLKGDCDLGIVPSSMRERLLPHNRLIANLQEVHDNHEPDQWETELKYVASWFNLTYTRPV